MVGFKRGSRLWVARFISWVILRKKAGGWFYLVEEGFAAYQQIWVLQSSAVSISDSTQLRFVVSTLECFQAQGACSICSENRLLAAIPVAWRVTLSLVSPAFSLQPPLLLQGSWQHGVLDPPALSRPCAFAGFVL